MNLTNLKHVRQWRNAFTLAEVLITLGIIGIVAALTMPILMQNYNKKVTETRLKKFYSTMNQTVERLKVDHGDLKDWDYTVDNVYEEGEEKTIDHLTNQSDAIAAKFEEYFGKYIEFVDKKKVEVEGKDRYLFYFKDGSAIMPAWYNNFDYEYFPKNPEKCLKNSRENRYGICSFAFQLYSNSENVHLHGFVPYFVGLSYNNGTFNIATMYNDPTKGCRNGTHMSGNYCGLIIMLNNWTVPDDYPRKLAY